MDGMIKTEFHGSDIEKIAAAYGIDSDEIISFAANVNPLGISDRLRTELGARIDCIQRYPDREYTELRRAIGSYCGTDMKNVIVGNGSSELISGLIKLKKGMKAVITAPAYSEYERNVRLTGGTVSYFRLREEDGFILNTDGLIKALSDEYDLLIMCNPVNPTSTAVKAAEMRRILDRCRDCHIIAVVDETYIEFSDEVGDITAVPLAEEYDNLFIIRSVSKFFAAPGLRLGYAVTGNSRIIELLGEKRDPWEVSSLAERAGRIMFSDKEYIQKTKLYMSAERRRVCGRLAQMSSMGLRYYEPQANFVLCHIEDDRTDADRLFEMCIRKGMMIRNCASFKFLDNKYFRFCFMKKKDDDRLLDTVTEALS